MGFNWRLRSFQYNSPNNFNDPFDTQTSLCFGFTDIECSTALNHEIFNLIHSPTIPKGDTSHPLFKDILQTWYLAKNSQRKATIEQLQLPRHLHDEISETIQIHLNELNETWKCMAKYSKIFCVAEEHTNLLMWAHYAKDHTGVVIKLKCIPELDTPLCIAQKVVYKKHPPVIAKLEEYIKYITGQKPEPYRNNSIFHRMFLAKSHHWEYEQEWRVFIPPENVDNLLTQKNIKEEKIEPHYVPFQDREIDSVFLGCKITYENKNKILEYLNNEFPHVRIFLSTQNKKKYKLEFNELK